MDAYVQPAVNASVSIPVDVSEWVSVGQVVYVEGGGHYNVTSVPDAKHIVVTNLGYTGNTSATTTISSGRKVSPAGLASGGGGGGGVLPPLSDVSGAALVEDGLGGLSFRRLRQADIDPNFAIATFVVSSPAPALYERGQSVSAGSAPQAALTYISGTPTSGTITNTYGGSSSGGDVALGTWTFTAPFANGSTSGSVKRDGADHGADPTLQITASCTQGLITSTSHVNLTWTSRVYSGLGAIGGGDTVNAGFVTGLPSGLSQNRLRNFTVSPANQYVYFAAPADYGTPTFTLNGFPAAFSKVSNALATTNAFSVTRAYDVWRSDNLLTGSNLTFIIG
jgi:hypothetical protein